MSHLVCFDVVLCINVFVVFEPLPKKEQKTKREKYLLAK